MRVTISLLVATCVAVTVASSAETTSFTCIKPINPIPAGPPGACCEELKQSHLVSFVYTGKKCIKANKISEAKDGQTTYEACTSGSKPACCDPLLMALNHNLNPACVLPVAL